MKSRPLLAMLLIAIVLAGSGLWWLQGAQAGPLSAGDRAPGFTTTGVLAGKTFTLTLADRLRDGPLVLYFFPKVFTAGCTAEAHEFAEKTPAFAAMGASVVGMSADSIADLAKFSVEACRDKFAVARATPAIIDAYRVRMPAVGMTNRTSYVIARDGRIVMVHSDLDYREHVSRTLAAVKALKTQ